MAVVQVVNTSSGEEFSVPAGEASVGRGPFLKVIDKRVSRHHASLRLEKGQLALYPKHKNPCFYKPAGDSKYEVLPKDKWKDLYHGDCFSLLPDDLVFKVVYPEQDKLTERTEDIPDTQSRDQLDVLFEPYPKETTIHSSPPKTTPMDTSAPSDTTKAPPHKETTRPTTSNGDIATDRVTLDVCEKSEVPVVKPKPSLKPIQSGSTGRTRALPNWLSGLSTEQGTSKTVLAPKKRKAPSSTGSSKAAASKGKEKDEDFGSPPPKKVPKRTKAPEPKTKEVLADSGDEMTLKDAEAKSKTLEARESAAINDKNDDNNRADSIPDTGGHASAHSDKDTEKDKGDRPACPYGASCYRKNPAHFREFSHDVSSVDTAASVDSTAASSLADDDSDKPICPYGTDCYRKNPAHRQEYRHIALSAKKRDSGKRTSNRTTKGKRSVMVGDSDDDGEPNTYDYNDSFIDDDQKSGGGDSSSYGDSEDSDWSPGGGVKEESEDIADLVSEATDFMSNEKMRRTT